MTALQDRMVRFHSGGWHCHRHALLAAAKTLVALYQVEGDADWSEIGDPIGLVLPEVIRKVDAAESSARRRP